MNGASFLRSVGLMSLAVMLSGCGAQTYEQRLNATKAYYDYRAKIDKALELRAWQNYGIDFRPPKGFVEQAAPKEDEPDQRLPPFLGSRLPGLLAVWHRDVKVDIPKSDISTRPAWVILCSNHSDWLATEGNNKVDPKTFHLNLADSLADALRFKRHSAVDPWKFLTERVPRGVAYVPIKSYDYITLDDEIEGVPTSIVYYRYSVQDIQMALITIAPKDIDRSEQFDLRISAGLEQLTMTGDIPRSQGKQKPVSGAGI